MGDHQHRAFLGVPDLEQLLLELLLGDRIQRTEGLIKDQHLGPDRQGAGNRHTLFHAPGDLGDHLVARRAQTHHLQMLEGDLLLGMLGQLWLHRIDRQVDILIGREPGQQGIALKHHHAVGPWLFDRPTLQQHAATAGGGETRHHVEQGALATAGMANHTDEFTLLNLQVHVFENGVRATRRFIHLAELLKTQQGRGLASWHGSVEERGGHCCKERSWEAVRRPAPLEHRD